MSDDDKPADNSHVRKTVSFTHRQLGVTGFALAGFLSIGQVKEVKEFLIGENTAAISKLEITMNNQFTELKQILRDQDTENVARLRRNRDLTTAEIIASESRCEKRSDKLDSRLNALEIYAFRTKAGKGSTN